MNGPTMIKPHLPSRMELNMDELERNLKEGAEKKEQIELAEIKRQQRMIELLESIDVTLKEIKDELKK
jgi:hypothetical protein